MDIIFLIFLTDRYDIFPDIFTYRMRYFSVLLFFSLLLDRCTFILNVHRPVFQSIEVLIGVVATKKEFAIGHAYANICLCSTGIATVNCG